MNGSSSKSLLLLLLCLISSCQGHVKEDYLLDEETSAELILDLIVLEEIITKYGGESKDLYRDSLKFLLVKKYGLEEDLMNRYLFELQQDPERYFKIQSIIEKDLEELSD